MAPYDFDLSRAPLCSSQEVHSLNLEENQCRVIDSNNSAAGRGSGGDFMNAIGMRGLLQSSKWGYLADPGPSWIQAIDQLSYEDFKGYVQEVLESRRFTFTVVTDPRRMSPKNLEKFGVLKEIKPELLFKN